MIGNAIPVAVAGVGSFGTRCLEALRSVPALRLVAVADRRGDLAEQAGRAHDVPFFLDERQFLSQSRPSVLIVATPPAPAADLIRLAARNGVHVLRPSPLARTLDEAVQLVRAMESAGRLFAVLSAPRFVASFRNPILARERLGKVFLGRAQHLLNWGPQFEWRGDQATAGGGVLLEAGYDMMDLLVWAMGLPEEVFAITGRKGRPFQRPGAEPSEPPSLYDTDDTAVVTLRCAGGAAGSIITSWVTSPPAQKLFLHGQLGTAEADTERCVHYDTDGTVLDRVAADSRPLGPLVRQLTALAAALGDAGPTGAPPCESAAREHLLTIAAVEAAYLSDRTGQGENPHRLLQARDLRPEDCYACRPAAIEPIT